MDTKLTLNYRLLIIGFPLAMILGMVALVNTEMYQSNTSVLANAITLDLVLTTPIIYFLLIRHKAVPKITVATVFVLSMISASYILPVEDQNLLEFVKTFALPVIELGIVGYVLYKTITIYREFKSHTEIAPDFFDVLYTATCKALPAPVSGLLATEIAVVYYSLINWKKKKSYEHNEYTYHTKNGIFSVIYAFMGLAIVELVAVHMLIAKYSHMWAWIASGLTIYSLLQIFALVKSMSRRPIILDHENNRLRLRYGFFSQVDINLDQIKKIELSRKSIAEDDNETISLSPLGLLDSHNMVLHLHEEHILMGLYGRKNKFMNLTIYADERERLNAEILKHLQ